MTGEIRITKSDALDRFIRERVMGDRKLAWDPASNTCQYGHSFHGGCEIGQYFLNPSVNIQKACTHPTVQALMEEAGFEDPLSLFWVALQQSHDNLALFLSDRGGYSTFWGAFQRSLEDVVRSL